MMSSTRDVLFRSQTPRGGRASKPVAASTLPPLDEELGLISFIGNIRLSCLTTSLGLITALAFITLVISGNGGGVPLLIIYH